MRKKKGYSIKCKTSEKNKKKSERKLKLKRLKRFEKFKQGNELRKKITNSIVYEI